METRKRSLQKTISWRIIATTITIVVSYLFTKQIAIATGIGLVDAIASMTGYYLHERVWVKI